MRDLHTVFPDVRLVAISSKRRNLAAAKRAGATLALPKRTPARTLRKAIRSLAGLR